MIELYFNQMFSLFPAKPSITTADVCLKFHAKTSLRSHSHLKFSNSFHHFEHHAQRRTPHSLPSPSHPQYRHHARCFRSRCPGGQVHRRLRRLLEASGKAPNPRSVTTLNKLKEKKRWTNSACAICTAIHTHTHIDQI
jgi:hypothetical protein